MEYKREDPKIRFTVPDKLTVREQMAYISTIALFGESQLFERMWEGAKTLIQEWECEIFPNKDADLSEVFDREVTTVLIWAGNKVRDHVDNLGGETKN